jgi:hypothetical protein
MANQETTVDPVIAEAGQRVERAKASLRARIAVLERRIGDVRERVDVPSQIRKHPWPAVGIALALGALAGRRREPSSSMALVAAPLASDIAAGGGLLGRTALRAIGRLGFRVVRELAIIQLSRVARRWWDEHGGPQFDDYQTGEYEAIDIVPDTGTSSPAFRR